ncbi:MAG TPA: DUF2339 domain-containing protein [Acetobacteraceae bacterium]|jgi:uncharacterized membrane protein|nr:DUF2339 domain-containing protein [Acetobacteraceae bacterium]
MMEFGFGVIAALAAIGGWILGVVGFFLALAARTEIARLRRTIADTYPQPLADTYPQPLADSYQPPQPVSPPAAAPIATPPPPPPEPADQPWKQAAPEAPSRDLEAVLTTRWGVWLGAAALMLAGVFLVRYAVDQGLLGPGPRCVLAGLLGCALIVAAEWLRRREAVHPEIADQAAPGLAGGGVAVLFGASYGAGVLYALIPPLAGFVLMAAASLVGLLLALRHGQLVAAVGLVGAFVTPALVQTDNPSLPGLFGYLLFVTGTALAVVRYAAWIWLGWGATIAGSVWMLLAIADGTGSEAWAPALFAPAAAALSLALLPGAALEHPVGRRLAWAPCAALGATGLLLAVLDQGWDARIGVLLFAPLTIWQAAREPRLRLLPFLAALLFLLLLATWSVEVRDWPDLAVPPGQWEPAVVQALLATAALVSGCFAVSGLWFERRSSHPLPWASLTASVPVLALAICYARVAEFRLDAGWAAFAILLAVGLTGVAVAAIREQRADGRARAGVHAAGAVAALALGCAMLLRDQWLTIAVSLFLPALAWVEAKAELPALRQVALAVAVLVLARLLLNWYVLDYGFGQWPVANDLLVAYGVPAAAFALAATLFRRRADDMAVGVLEAGSVAFVTVLVALEVHQGFQPADGRRTLPGEFAEAALHVGSMAVLAVATLRIAERLDRPVLRWCWRIQGAVALVGGSLLIVANPAVTNLPVGSTKLLDWLLPAYLLPALLAAVALREPATGHPTGLRTLLAGYALLAGFAWITLEVRHLFNPGPIGLVEVAVQDAELWAWSGAWLAYGIAVMAIGIGVGARQLRLAALAIVGLATAKVFLVDMAGLVGLWRVLSFLGLGLVLIGFGAAYRRLVAPTPAHEA